MGKFYKMQHTRPLSAIFSAFNEYCHLLYEENSRRGMEIAESLKDALGDDGMKVLMNVIPNLSKITRECSAVAFDLQGKQAYSRLKFIFRAFVRAISSPSHPIILFLDDLQWSDEESLELLELLMADAKNTNLVFLGCYRDNEVGRDHPLKHNLRRIADLGVAKTEILLGNMDKKNVNEMISEVLHLMPRVTIPLANIVHRKTGGNALFVTQFVNSLLDEGLLHYSFNARSWEWSIDMIESKDIADNVVDHMMRKMLKLPHDIQLGLKNASCIGNQCEESVLQLLDGTEKNLCDGIVKSLDVAVHEGLMVKLGTLYRFSHDEIHRAAYSLVALDEREALHLEIGRLLRKESRDVDMDDSFYISIDQMKRGSTLISDRREKTDLATLNLRAGERAVAMSSFLTASIYFFDGICLLDESDWTENYDLNLRLFTCYAEALFVIGNYAIIDKVLFSIFDHARCTHDKIRAYFVYIKMLNAQNKSAVATGIAFEVLELLGEVFPETIDDGMILDEVVKTKDLLSNIFNLGNSGYFGL